MKIKKIRKIKNIISTLLVALLIFSSITIIGTACYFQDGRAGTYNTYINASSTFTSKYYTDSNPTITYRYRNLKCDEPNAKMSTALYAMKIKWHNLFAPTQYKVDQISNKGLNDGTTTTWYSYTFENVDCSSVAEIQKKWPSWSFDECSNLLFEYIISGNNGKKIKNNMGEWQVICEYK